MAKITKGPDKAPQKGPAKAEPKAAKAKDKDEKDSKPGVPLEKDELTEFRAQKKAEEEEGISRVIKDVTARKAAAATVSLENFDWEAFDKKGFGEGYSKSERESLLNLYSGTVATVNESEVVQGVVVGINDRDVILNIGFKSDGLVPLAEFKDTPNLKIGDTVDLFIEERENAMGQLVLSRRKAKLVKGWEYVQTALDKDQVIEGFVKRRTKGGLIVDVYGIEAFLPGSQIDVKPIRDFDVYVNKSIEVKVVKINYTNDNVVVSHKVLIEKDLEQQKAAILTNLDKGQVLEGVIKNMTNFGVFIDLGGVDGLLHITDISWGRISHPEEVLKLDQTVKVVVLDFDHEKKRISLGMKQLTPHPWDSLPAEIQIGSKVKGRIVNVADYGAFLELQPGVEGLIHVSEMSWSQHLRNPQDFIKVGDEIEAVVLTIDRDERKMSLGIKQLTEDPWTRQNVLTKYAIGTTHKGIVRNLTNFGLFLELEEGIDGLVHVSDLSWTRKIKHPSEFIKVGETLEVKVLELDATNRRLALSHKHMEENPWDHFEKIFTIGSVHKGTILNKNDKGAIVELPYGIEGFVAIRNLAKQDNGKAEVGEGLDLKVLEFSKEDRRISLSHKATWSSEEEVKEAPKKKPAHKGKTIEKINNETEKSTLGDLDALAALKEKMSGGKGGASENK
jgi:small subunit ribosomal protein S1